MLHKNFTTCDGNGDFKQLYSFLDYKDVYRRQPKDSLEAKYLVEALFIDSEKKTTASLIEHDIQQLRDKKNRYADAKKKQYDLIASGFIDYFKTTGIKTFRREFILSFIDAKYFPLSSVKATGKRIIDLLKLKDVIADGENEKITRQRRVYSLRSENFDNSYAVLMWTNGFRDVKYSKFVCDSDGIPRKKRVGTGRINRFPHWDLSDDEIINDKGDSVDSWDIAELIATKQPTNTGVYSFGNKSIALQQRRYTRKCFQVIA